MNGAAAHGDCPSGLVCGSTGCRECLADRECAENSKCCAGSCMAVEACSVCTADRQCSTGQVCCGGSCTGGNCCSAGDCDGRPCLNNRCALSLLSVRPTTNDCTSNAQCPEGKSCVAGQCAACTADAQCGADARCCGGVCSAGTCCGDSDCGAGGSCQNGSCQRCTADVECGSNEKCCGGSCVPGNCCGGADCEGRACRQNACQPCADSTQCGASQVCCGGLCREGACCATADCALGQVCTAGACTACRGDPECGAGARCVQGACIPDAECGNNLDCSDGMCVVRALLPPPANVLGVSCQQTTDCGFAEVCCGNVCVSGECCGTADCAALGYPQGMQCLQNACQPCTADAQCGASQVCCGGSCHAGDCCPGQVCSTGQICSAYQCAACVTSADCGNGRVCCGGVCKDGNCCTNGNCGQYVCQGNTCGVCNADGDCAANSRCCNGACTANAACCDSNDCPAGKICRNNACATCRNNKDCSSGDVCCNGACRNGNCCTTADCSGGATCNPSGFCGMCASDSQCAVGQKCCGGACVNGACCTTADCGGGQVCTGNSCASCTGNQDCGRGQVCCNGGCQTGNCCVPRGAGPASPECNGLVCVGSQCTQCTADTQCGAGAKCCRGACYAGAGCCASSDCPGSLACVAGSCSSCTSDAQCGALSCCDDDGAGPQPGRCKPFCSITQTYGNLATFNQGTYNGTSATGSPLNPACVGALCWAGEDVVISVPYLWVPNTGDGKLYRYNVNTGAVTGGFNTSVVANWPAADGTAPGCSISRTAVNPFDATVWVADRCGRTGGGVAHLDYSGTMLCFADVSGGPRGVATDADGNVWVGSGVEGTMRKFSGSEFEPGNTSPKRCKLLQTVSVPGPGVYGYFVYGAAADNNNLIWLQQHSALLALNANTGLVVKNYPTPGCQGYGITVDQEYVWMGCYWTGNVARIRKSDGAVALAATGGNPRGIATSTDGFVYAAGWNNQVYKINRNTMAFTGITVPLAQVISTAVDSADRVWAVDYGGPLVRIAPNGAQQSFGSGGRSQYVYTDLTGQQTINAGLTPGLWSVINDANYPTPHWTRLNFATIKPPNTTVSARVKVASSAAALTTSLWWNGLLPESTYRLETNGVVRLDDIPGLPAARFILIEVKLTTASSTVTPVVQSVSSTWAP